ncbi:MAG: hypothetical protein IPN67_06385 [Bacteroidales bacterium]|nr:hypothetical protein [Bacteroidales bacterium]
MIGFPHGNSSTEVKVFEAEKACRDGAYEIDMVINIGKTLGGDWEYVSNEMFSFILILVNYEKKALFFGSAVIVPGFIYVSCW